VLSRRFGREIVSADGAGERAPMRRS